MHPADERLARVRRAAGVPSGPATLLPSDSNDTWRIGDVILRVCWRGDRGRFAREAAVAAALPPGFPYPETLGAGVAGDLAWQVTRAVDGEPLAAAWPRLSRGQRRDAIHQIGAALAALHAHRFPSHVLAALAAPRPVGDASPSALIGADLIPLPYPRAALLLEPARRLPHVDPGLIDDIGARMRELAVVDPLNDPGTACVHGDAHPDNALWRDGRLVALLDLEWVRLGPAELELGPYLRAEEAPEALAWLAESHPATVAAARLQDRLWLAYLAYTLRQLLICPPERPIDELTEDHPLWALHRVVNRPVPLPESMSRLC